MDAPTPAVIRTVRDKLGLTQTAAAHSIGVHMRTWQDWEAGKARMRPVIWQGFCNQWKVKA